ncbi:uncharacterized protein O3C94_021915, partial [Discoglossus pictus]
MGTCKGIWIPACAIIIVVTCLQVQGSRRSHNQQSYSDAFRTSDKVKNYFGNDAPEEAKHSVSRRDLDNGEKAPKQSRKDASSEPSVPVNRLDSMEQSRKQLEDSGEDEYYYDSPEEKGFQEQRDNDDDVEESSSKDQSWYFQQRNSYDKKADKTAQSSKITFIPPTTAPIIRKSVTAHNGQVCSTWGNSYYKTFDGDIFYYPGTCNYLYASNCKSNYEEFNIQIRRLVEKNLPTISHIYIKIDGAFIEMTSGNITFNGEQVELPYSFSGVQIERNGMYIRVTAKL